MRKAWLLLGLLLAPSAIFAQGGSISSGGILVLSPLGRPIGGATVTVCAFGATGIPCSPTITVYTDPTLGTPALNPATSDGNGSVFVYAAPGSYTYTVTGTGITGKSFTATVSGSGGGNVINGGSPSFVNLTVSGTATLGNGSAFAPVTFSNHNAMYWAGPGLTPTIDQAVTACGANPCIVAISPTYSGPESVLIVTTSMGYKVYSGANNVTILDHRQVDSGSGNPTGTNLYGIMYGGRNAGALNRIACNYYANNATDSTTCSNSFNWVTGSFAQNTGAMNGAVSFVSTVGSVTIGANGGIVDAQDGEAYHNATSVDRDLPYITGFTGQSGMSRSGAVGNITTASAYLGNGCANVSSTAKLGRCYVFDSLLPSTGVSENYGYHNYGSWLSESTQTFDYVGAGFSITAASESSTTVTITTSSTCNFITGDKVRVSGVGGISATVIGYNGVWTVLTPGCNGGSTFTYTDTTSGLGTLGAGGTARGLYSALSWLGNGGLSFGASPSGFLFNTNGATPVRILSSIINSFVPHEFTLRAIFDEVAAPSGSATQDLLWGDSGDHFLHFNPNNQGNQQVAQVFFAGSTYTNATTTFSTLTNMTFTAKASTNYTMSCKLYLQGSATTAGPKFQLTGPASPTSVTLAVGPFDPIAKTTTNVVTGAAFASPNTTFGTIGALGVNYEVDVTATVRNGVNAGAVALQAAANGAGTLTVQADSSCRIQ